MKYYFLYIEQLQGCQNVKNGKTASSNTVARVTLSPSCLFCCCILPRTKNQNIICAKKHSNTMEHHVAVVSEVAHVCVYLSDLNLFASYLNVIFPY